jgi:photosynthetic reaction center cytochrome c subunit
MLGADAKVKVTCYTCHRGKNIPESTPPPATPGQ